MTAQLLTLLFCPTPSLSLQQFKSFSKLKRAKTKNEKSGRYMCSFFSSLLTYDKPYKQEEKTKKSKEDECSSNSNSSSKSKTRIFPVQVYTLKKYNHPLVDYISGFSICLLLATIAVNCQNSKCVQESVESRSMICSFYGFFYIAGRHICVYIFYTQCFQNNCF